MIVNSVTFYKYPFMKGGERRPLFTTTSAFLTSMAQFQSAQYTLTAAEQQRFQFVDNQPSFFHTPYSAVKDSNYVIMVMQSGESTEYRAYWVDSIVPLFGEADTCIIYIDEDIVVSEWLNANGELLEVRGRILQTTLVSPDNNVKNLQLVPPVAPSWNGAFPFEWSTFAPTPQTAGAYAYRICASISTENGDVFCLYSAPKIYTDRSLKEGSVQAALKTFSLISSITPFGGGEEINVSLNSLYCFPYFMVPDKFTPAAQPNYIIKAVDGKEENGFVLILATSTGHEPILIPITPKLLPYSKLYIQTPARFIEMNVSTGARFSPTAWFDYSSETQNSDAPTICIVVNGEPIDITQDFLVDFAVNQTALNMSQHKIANAINDVSTIIASVGGAIGGFASKNFFGGIQSIVSGVGTLTDKYAALSSPAQIKGGGSGANLLSCGGIGYIYSTTPSNNNEIAAEIEMYGYVIPSRPTASLTVFSANDYIRMADVQVWGIYGNSVDFDTAQAFKQMYENGVKFIDISS